MRLGLGVCENVNVSNAEMMQLATYLPIRINNCGRVLADVYTSHEKLVQSLFAMRTTPLVALAYLHPIGLWVIKVGVGCAGGVVVMPAPVCGNVNVDVYISHEIEVKQ